jgi:hypothetical protein
MDVAFFPTIETGQLKPHRRGLLVAVAERAHVPLRPLEKAIFASGGR